MLPVIYTEDTLIDQKDQFLEASILHGIPTELLMQSSSSTQYFQSFPNETMSLVASSSIKIGRSYRRWLLQRRKHSKNERLRKLAKLHAELLGKSAGGDPTFQRQLDLDPSEDIIKEEDEMKNPSIDRNESLLDITLKTMVLLHHNQQLQNKLTALQMETRKLLRSNLKHTLGQADSCSFKEQDV